MEVPDLVSSSSSLKSSESSSECSSDEGVVFLKLDCHFKDGSWRLFSTISENKIDLISEIELISPFIFIKDFAINLLNVWLKNSNFSLVDTSVKQNWKTEEKHWSDACLFIELYNRMSECMPVNLQEYIKKNHNVFTQLKSYNKLEDAIDFIFEIEWFQKMRNSVKFGKPFDISTAMLIISFYVSSNIIEKQDAVNEFIDSCQRDEESLSTLLRSADESFNQRHYEEALNTYNQYCLVHPFNYKAYNQRAAVHTQLNNMGLAEFDKKRSYILQGIFSQNSDKIDEILKKMDLSVPMYPGKNEIDSKVVTDQHESNQYSQNEMTDGCDAQCFNNCIPELVSSSESGGEEDDEVEKNVETGLNFKDRTSTIVTTTTTTVVTIAEAITTVASSTISSTAVTTTSSTSHSKKSLCLLKENIRDASYAFLNGSADKAVNLFARAIKAAVQMKGDFKVKDIVLLNYAYGCSHAAIGTFESLIQAISIFEDVCKLYPSSTFPLIYYQVGRCYSKLNRFKQALNPLKEGLEQLNNLSSMPTYYWPETAVALDENSPGKLKFAMEELRLICQKPPPPDVLCRYDKCSEFKKEIYFSDPDLKGFTVMKCKERCALNYHLNCWKMLKDDLHKTNDKEFLGSTCLTPDCKSCIQEIVYLDNKGDIMKQFAWAVKETPVLKPKPKKLRIEKKKLKNRKKKIIPTTASTEIQQLATEVGCANEEEESEDKPILPTSKINRPLPQCSTVIDSSKVQILKKHEDELESNQTKCVRQREKKKEKKKPIKMMSLDEFLGDRTNEPQLLYNEYVQRLMKLQEYRNEVEIGENNMDKHELPSITSELLLNNSPYDLQSFMNETETSTQLLTENIIFYFEKFLERNGPLQLKDSLLSEEIWKMSLKCQEFIFSSGGLLNILEQSEKFLVINDFIYLADVAESGRKGIKNDDMELCSFKENKLDSLDSFDLIACGGDYDNENNSPTASHAEDILRNYESEPLNGNPLAESPKKNCQDKPTLIQNNAYFSESAETLDKSMTNITSSYGKSEIELSAEKTKANDLKCGSDFDPNSRKKLSQSRILQKVLQFLPLFSKESKTKLLCLILKTIVTEKTLLQYKENYAQNIDVQGLEKYFIYAAEVLKRVSNKKTQTEFPQIDLKMKEEIESLRNENTLMSSKLSEYEIMESGMKALQQEINNYQIQLQQRNLLLQKREKQLQSLYLMIQAAQKQHEKDKEELKMRIEKLEEEVKVCKNKNGELQQKIKTENGWDMKLQDAIAPSSSIPAVNSFEKLILKLHSRFPSFSRDKLKVYVQQLRSRHRNHLTGLTLEQITCEVSAMISNEMAEKGAVPRNVLGKQFASNTSVPLSSLDDISEYDNAWGLPSSLIPKWSCNEDNNDDMCLICHEDMIKENSLKLQCSHLFHSKCIREWFRQQSTCPVCRVHSLLPDEFPSLT